MKKVLIWLYDQTIVASMRNLLEDEYEVLSAFDAREFLSQLRRKNPEILLFDYNLCLKDFLEGLKKDPERFRNLSLIHLIAPETLEVNRHKLSEPFDIYLEKPYRSRDLLPAFQRLEELRGNGERLNLFLDQFAEKRDFFQELVAFSDKMREVIGQGRIVAGNDIPVLLEGETGTGKTKLAEAIHHSGKRGKGPFIPLNCSAIPENLLESELFGYKRGAFTGAYEDKKGKVAEADGGTLFLDEIGDMPLSLQPKLLKVLEDRSWFPLGASRAEQSDFRLVCASNQDLLELVNQGRFREDLYYRINIFPIKIPPLRERREDIPVLALRFFDEVRRKYSLNLEGLSRKYLENISTHPWRGNIRELRNEIERSALLNSDGILAVNEKEAVEKEVKGLVDASLTYAEATRRVMGKVEEEYLSKVIAKYNGRVGKAAEHAGIDRKTFREKLKLYGIIKEDFKGT